MVVPEGFLRVKGVTVAPQEAIDETYEEKVTQMSEYEAEYGKLMLEDEKANAARLKEIKTLYDALRVETDQMYEAYMADAKAKIEEAKAKLDGGESIDAVLESYGEDAAYTEYALIAEHGRLMAQQSGADDFDDTLRNAALALADGPYSDVLQADDTYYIVYRVGTETAGTRTLDEVREAVEAAALTAEADAVWAEQGGRVGRGRLHGHLSRGGLSFDRQVLSRRGTPVAGRGRAAAVRAPFCVYGRANLRQWGSKNGRRRDIIPCHSVSCMGGDAGLGRREIVSLRKPTLELQGAAVLVTGAAGFIGFHVSRALLAQGVRVTGLDNLNDYYDPALKRARARPAGAGAGFAFVQADLADAAAVECGVCRVQAGGGGEPGGAGRRALFDREPARVY